jgi:hypothetical protein
MLAEYHRTIAMELPGINSSYLKECVPIGMKGVMIVQFLLKLLRYVCRTPFLSIRAEEQTDQSEFQTYLRVTTERDFPNASEESKWVRIETDLRRASWNLVFITCFNEFMQGQLLKSIKSTIALRTLLVEALGMIA